jgi:hypothetical protein
MGEPTFQDDKVSSLVGSLHLSDYSRSFQLQRLLSIKAFDFNGSERLFPTRFLFSQSRPDLIFNGLAFPSSCHAFP